MLALAAASLTFVQPAVFPGTPATRHSAAVQMRAGDSTLVSRRDHLLQLAASGLALASAPLAASADGANSKATVERAKSIYGSRIFRLQNAAPEVVLEEANAFQLYITGAVRGASSEAAAKKKELLAAKKKILAAAKAGDSATTKSLVGAFIKSEGLSELDRVPGNNWDARQRRNPGAPPTSEIEAQMGTSAYALYAPLATQVTEYNFKKP